MKTDDFDFVLPEELIAQTPLKDRSSSRLLILNRENPETIKEKHFSDILDYFNPGDALVLNETKVLPARIFGHRADTGGKIEVLLLKDLGNDTWECLTRPQKRLKNGKSILFFKNENDKEPLMSAHVEELKEEGITVLKFTYAGVFLEILDKLGSMPLPPYIHEKLKDKDRYQTVYAKNLGSAAAPTAGLHFTPELLKKAKNRGIKIIKITLHVGLGTFRPVNVDDVKKHKMHTETYVITEEAAKEIEEVRASGGKIIAVGTTTVRTLETVAKKFDGKIIADRGETDIFIYPGFKFEVVNHLITNFHLPKSTLLMLVSAFMEEKLPEKSPFKASSSLPGRDLVLRAYDYAIENKFRFFSFGDAMLIL
ncbi:tRNA preQ1(34) S-adenosylmethionine ribosyltransferase-isomerase QueA [Candidatus Saccharibacteria bacterium]|nr:tRNA preQ1(34) S-adenosylmethionine ribosyltransferase-isomerase QueA [Candidatus Saccharibacteria bacterium]